MSNDRTRWTAVAAALLAGVVTGCAFGKMAPALPVLKAELGLSLVQTGWLVSAFNGLAAVGAIFFGLVSELLRQALSLQEIIYGAILMGFMMFKPRGLFADSKKRAARGSPDKAVT